MTFSDFEFTPQNLIRVPLITIRQPTSRGPRRRVHSFFWASNHSLGALQATRRALSEFTAVTNVRIDNVTNNLSACRYDPPHLGYRPSIHPSIYRLPPFRRRPPAVLPTATAVAFFTPLAPPALLTSSSSPSPSDDDDDDDDALAFPFPFSAV